MNTTLRNVMKKARQRAAESWNKEVQDNIFRFLTCGYDEESEVGAWILAINAPRIMGLIDSFMAFEGDEFTEDSFSPDLVKRLKGAREKARGVCELSGWSAGQNVSCPMPAGTNCAACDLFFNCPIVGGQ